MATQTTDKLLISRSNTSYQVTYQELYQGIPSGVAVGTTDLDGAQVILEQSANDNLPHLALRRTASNGTDVKMISFMLDGDDGSSTNLYAYPNISIIAGTAPQAGDNSVAEGVALQMTAPGGIALGTGNGERLRIDPAGRLGIGVSTPIAPLHARISDTSPTYVLGPEVSALFERNDDNKIVIQASATGSASVSFGDGADYDMGLVTYDNSTNNMSISVNNTETVVFDNGGDILLGGTLPSSPNVAIRAEGVVSLKNFANLAALQLAWTSPAAGDIAMVNGVIAWYTGTNWVTPAATTILS